MSRRQRGPVGAPAPAKELPQECMSWQVIYPVYIDAKKTQKEGRRLPIEKCCENPTSQEICDVCRHLGFQAEIEPDKAYPRNFFLRGRVRVEIKKQGNSVHEEIKTKGHLLIKLGELIPKLASRHAPPPQEGKKGGKKKKKGRR